MKAKALAPYVFWMLLALPGALLLYRYGVGDTFYGEVIHRSGLCAVWLLMATLAISPVCQLFPSASFKRVLLPYRRYLGVAAFSYAALHTGVYIARKASAERVLAEAVEPGLLTGWIALAIFLPLAVSSNDRSLRLLRRWWKRLHRSVYLAAMLVFAHWWLTAFDPAQAQYHLAALLGLELARLALQWRRSRPTPTAG